jgi:hypothetical protein
MSGEEQVALVRCRLDGRDDVDTVRYVPLSEFGLWRYLMEHRHGRSISVDATSLWVAEPASWWNSGFREEELVPVLRLRFERAHGDGVSEIVERFFPAETYPEAQEALLSHFGGPQLRLVAASPGYFVPAGVAPARKTALSA